MGLRKKYGYLLAALICVLGILALLNHKKEQEYGIERTLKYRFTVTNPTNRFLEQSSMWMYLPVKQTSTQKFISVQTSDSYHLIADDLGNQKMVFELHDIAPYGSKVVSVNVRVDMSELPNTVIVDDLTPYLESEKHIESDNAAIVTLAAGLKKNNEVSTIEAIYQWALENMTYEGYVAEDRGALYAVEHGEGDCTEYAHLVTALARATHIPSRSVAGFAYSENARVVAKDYHNWSEVLVDGKWWLVDAQKKAFMEKFSDYIAMRVISTAEGIRAGNSQEYFHVSDPLVAVMR